MQKWSYKYTFLYLNGDKPAKIEYEISAEKEKRYIVHCKNKKVIFNCINEANEFLRKIGYQLWAFGHESGKTAA